MGRWVTVHWIGLATIPVLNHIVSNTLEVPWRLSFEPTKNFKDITPFDEEHPNRERSISVFIEEDYANS